MQDVLQNQESEKSKFYLIRSKTSLINQLSIFSNHFISLNVNQLCCLQCPSQLSKIRIRQSGIFVAVLVLRHFHFIYLRDLIFNSA